MSTYPRIASRTVTTARPDRRRRGTVAVLFALALAAVAFVPAAGAAEAAGGVVNINQADATALMLLPRVGPSLAERIVTFREENGPFKTPEDLILVRGIGEKTFASMAPHIVVEGKTTLDEKVRPSRAAIRPAALSARSTPTSTRPRSGC